MKLNKKNTTKTTKTTKIKNTSHLKQLLSNEKANIGVNTIFYILMSIFMVAILIFGYQKIFVVKEQISNQELLEVKNKIEKTLSYCDDPLNKGNFKKTQIKHKSFNGIYFVQNDIMGAPDTQMYKDLKTIYESGENVVLFKADYHFDADKNINFKTFNVIDTLKLDVDFSKSFFYLDGDTKSDADKKRDGTITINIECG